METAKERALPILELILAIVEAVEEEAVVCSWHTPQGCSWAAWGLAFVRHHSCRCLLARHSQ